MTNLREDVAALARRTAEEFNKLREEIEGIEGGTGGEGGSSGPCTAENTVYENYGYHNVSEALDSLLYTPISITSFSNNKGTLEKGNKVTEVTLSWNINKTPKSLTLSFGNDSSVLTPTQSGSTKFTSDNISNTTASTWTLKAADEKKEVSAKTSIDYKFKVFYGTGTVGADGITDDFIKGLSGQQLSASFYSPVTITAEAGQYIYYVFPSSYGTPMFKVGGFEGGFDKLCDHSFTNAHGYTYQYTVYRSTNKGLGSTKIEVSKA